MRSLGKTMLAMLIGLALAGCSLAPIHATPPAPLPADWKPQDRATAAGSAQAPRAQDLDWELFVGDPALRRLIGTALAHNRSLRQTLLDVEAVRARYAIQRADRMPGLDLQLGGSRQRTPAGGVPGVQSAWQAGAAVTAFELDLFGRVRNLSQAALEEYLASEQTARAARISLVDEVIRVYLGRDSAIQAREITQRALASREASLQLVERRRQAGVATALDHQQALGLTEQAKAELERVDRTVRQADNALELLTGVAAPELPAAPAAEPILVGGLAAGLPSDLLAARPDIAAAEHLLRARNASIGAARAAFFPRIALTGSLGSSSTELSDLFSSGGRSWSFAPQLSLPIFDGGRNAANLDLAKVRKEAAVAAYEETVQTAFREVSDALAAVDTLRREEAARNALAASSQAALRLSEARWRAGVDDQLRYLDAQRSAFADRLAAVQAGTEHQLALATLFKTLGGGWPAKRNLP